MSKSIVASPAAIKAFKELLSADLKAGNAAQTMARCIVADLGVKPEYADRIAYRGQFVVVVPKDSTDAVKAVFEREKRAFSRAMQFAREQLGFVELDAQGKARDKVAKGAKSAKVSPATTGAKAGYVLPEGVSKDNVSQLACIMATKEGRAAFAQLYLDSKAATQQAA